MSANFSYLILEVIFTGLALSLEWGLHGRFLWSKRRVILKTLLFLFPYAVFIDGVAIRLGLWGFAADKILNFWICGIPVDEFLWILLTFTAISSATLIFADFENRGLRKREFPLYFFKIKN